MAMLITGALESKRKHPRPRKLSRSTNTPNSRKLSQPPQLPQTILRSATSGTFRDFWKNDDKKIGFYFLTYEWSRRRLSLIKTNNEGEEVFALPFSALDYEYLFWKYRLTRLKSEII